ncbi:MAG: glycosyltransferase family 9 protein [Sporomusaceae bacterium]|nr:glycosyltransferase family 9 protein [Sporomusaceae bacterium]
MLILPEQINKILMVTITHIGDIVLSCPTTRALKKYFPHAEIDMLVSMPQGEAAFHNPHVSNVIFYGIENWQRDRAKLMKLIQALRQKKYDLALSSRHGSADPMMAFLSGAVYRAGFDTHGGGKFLTHMLPLDPIVIRHETEYQLALLAMLGITSEDTNIEFLVSDEEESSLNMKLPRLQDNGRPIVLLCPFSDDPQKNWTDNGYVEVLRTLAEFADCYLLGSLRQLTALRSINTAAGNVAEVLGGLLSLGELAALIRAADLLITVDTGPMHIAQAFSTPVVALMGPTDPRVWGPRNPGDVVLTKPMECAPCWHKDESIKKSCRFNECMWRIRPDDVIKAATGILTVSAKTP